VGESKYDIIRNQVAPILNGARTDCEAIQKEAKSLLSLVADGTEAAGPGTLVAGALAGFGYSTAGHVRDALSLAGRVVGAGFNATNAYIRADFHMTGNVHRAIGAGLPSLWERKFGGMR
jgi:Family of unknown function (DUF6507)